MCGITGHVGVDDSLSIVAESLANLEYRGYDSAGVALDDGGLHVRKQEGVVGDLALPSGTDARRAIGHTRWSTHGEPTDDNAHPHTDCTGEVAVVHNGIIENYAELREELAERGHTFTSETDTEVVPHLLEEELAAGVDLLTATRRVADRLAGSFALAIVAADREDIVVARRDSPLVVGHGADGQFVASDVPAFVEHTREVTYLEDGDVASVRGDGVEVFNGGVRVERDRQTVEWDAEAAEKGGYDHYMLKEIHEQPYALRQALTGRVDDAGDVALDLSPPGGYLDSVEEVQFVACGTSYHAALYGARLLEELADVRATVTIASEYTFPGGRDPEETLALAVTQSGETADTLAALRRADAAGTRTMAVTNTVGSTVTREADDSVFIRAGPEIGVAATKTFVSQVATLTMLAVHVGRERGTLSSERASALLDNLRALPGAVQQVLDRSERVRAVAETQADSDAFFFVGRRFGHPVSLEGALKLKEISYDHAEGFAAGELKHGTLALVTDETTVVATLTGGGRPDETLNNVKEVQSRGADVVGLSSTPDHEKFLDTRLPVPDLGLLEPLVANVYCQLFAYHVADLKGRPIDKPRNLAKSVTVE